MTTAVNAAMQAFWDYRFAGRTLHDPVRMEAALRAVALTADPPLSAALLEYLNRSGSPNAGS